jgi:hypothetical protein
MNPSSAWSTFTQRPFEIMEILVSHYNLNKHEYRINCHEKSRHQEGIVINLKINNCHQLSSTWKQGTMRQIRTSNVKRNPRKMKLI